MVTLHRLDVNQSQKNLIISYENPDSKFNQAKQQQHHVPSDVKIENNPNVDGRPQPQPQQTNLRQKQQIQRRQNHQTHNY